MSDDRRTLDLDGGIGPLNSQVVEAAPAVAVASSMLTLACALSRETLNAANQSQLNGIVGMAQAAQLCRQAAAGDGGLALKEALDLLWQAAANAPER
ncbi:MAG TPA: hypothetical protein VFR28_09630 [Allosphingosinicella sp.]|jgi:hypothetical protein|nr:hypothetical protein [Allosphingosinicella sp.]